MMDGTNAFFSHNRRHFGVSGVAFLLLGDLLNYQMPTSHLPTNTAISGTARGWGL